MLHMYIPQCCEGTQQQDVSELFKFNRVIGERVTQYKNTIDEHATDKQNTWDQVKKYSNDYEFLFSSMMKYSWVAAMHPPSRSYFKMWEIMKAMESYFMEPIERKEKMVSAHIAEGPGGFMESVFDWYVNGGGRSYPFIDMHGMTLISSDRIVPQWRISRSKMQSGLIHLHAGKDGTGNIYKLDNIHHFVESVGGRQVCHLVTGDGGFDIHGQFNDQECVLQHLLLCQIYMALLLQREGGTFVLKVFDTYSETTLQLLYICRLFYRDMHMCKPLSSRPANSEKYVVCHGFRADLFVVHKDLLRSMEMIIDSLSISRTPDRTPFHPFIPCDVPADFLMHMTQFNMEYSTQQMFHICKTLAYIAILQSKKHKDFLKNIVRDQYMLCKEWCIYHEIPYDVKISLESRSGSMDAEFQDSHGVKDPQDGGAPPSEINGLT